MTIGNHTNRKASRQMDEAFVWGIEDSAGQRRFVTRLVAWILVCAASSLLGGACSCEPGPSHAPVCASAEEIGRLREENADLRGRIATLSQTPAQRIEEAIGRLNDATKAEQLDRLLLAFEQGASLLGIYPEAPEAPGLRAVVKSAEAMKSALVGIDEALEKGQFQVANRILKKEGKVLSEARRAEIVRTIADRQMAPVDTSFRLVENFPADWIGRRVRISASFTGLNQNWVSKLPGVRGSYVSPEAGVHSFDRRKAIEWVGFYARDDELFQFLFARKSEHGALLASLERYQQITLVGTVVDFGSNNWAAILVDQIQVTGEPQDPWR